MVGEPPRNAMMIGWLMIIIRGDTFLLQPEKVWVCVTKHLGNTELPTVWTCLKSHFLHYLPAMHWSIPQFWTNHCTWCGGDKLHYIYIFQINPTQLASQIQHHHSALLLKHLRQWCGPRSGKRAWRIWDKLFSVTQFLQRYAEENQRLNGDRKR